MNSLSVIEGFQGIKLFYKQGDEVSKIVDLNTCLGIIYFSHTSASIIGKRVDCAKNIILKKIEDIILYFLWIISSIKNN